MKSLLIILLMGAAFSIFAESYYLVYKTDDDGTIGTLRWAIENVPDGGKIVFNLLQDNITLEQGELSVSKNLAIDGKNQVTGNNVTIDANKKSRVMEIAPNADVTISNLNFTNGYVYANMEDAYGGGILNNGNLTLSYCNILNNEAKAESGFYSNGGGIYNRGTLILNKCEVSGNIATADFGGVGGGISTIGDLIINEGCVIDNNKSFLVSGEHASGGGGIDAYNCKVTISGAEIKGNSALYDLSYAHFSAGYGGGIEVGGSLWYLQYYA